MTTTAKYVVKLRTPGFANSPISWNCRTDGRPTGANLRRYVEGFEASTQPGGVNAHLGPVKVASAVITQNFSVGRVVASYEAPREPLFQIVTVDYHQ